MNCSTLVQSVFLAVHKCFPKYHVRLCGKTQLHTLYFGAMTCKTSGLSTALSDSLESQECLTLQLLGLEYR